MTALLILLAAICVSGTWSVTKLSPVSGTWSVSSWSVAVLAQRAMEEEK